MNAEYKFYLLIDVPTREKQSALKLWCGHIIRSNSQDRAWLKMASKSMGRRREEVSILCMYGIYQLQYAYAQAFWETEDK